MVEFWWGEKNCLDSTEDLHKGVSFPHFDEFLSQKKTLISTND
jgi:hypothetical protein